MNTIGFLGTGNMGTAILKGIAGSSMKSETKLYAYNPTAAKVDALASYGVQKCSSEAEVAAASQYLFLAIKPQKFDEVLPRIADAITEDTVLVSIAAGIGVEYIRKLTNPTQKLFLPCRTRRCFSAAVQRHLPQKHRYRMQNLLLYAVFSMPAA